MEHAVSAYHPNVPHGAGLAMLSAAYFGWIGRRRPDRFGDLAMAMGQNVESLAEEERPGAFIAALKKLINDVGLGDERLSDYGIRKNELRKLAENSFDVMGKLYAITPVEMTVDDAVTIYENAYDHVS
jgi:alcohol dehydrogenase